MVCVIFSNILESTGKNNKSKTKAGNIEKQENNSIVMQFR